MSDFIALIVQVLAIPLTLGGVTMPLGSVLLGIIILRQGFLFFSSLISDRADLNRSARDKGFWDWEEYEAYTNYMGGHEKGK